jgi:hypothetical protein
MNCQKVRSFLSTYSEGLLPSDKSNELEAHIKNCKRCEQEKRYLEQILAAARVLPKKSPPDDFNLKLMNRIYAEQGKPTESYLPAEAPSFFGRQVKWLAAVATVVVCALATVFVLQRTQTPVNVEQPNPSYSSTTAPAPGNVMRASATFHHPEQLRQLQDVIGVSGPASNYRATNIEALRAFQIDKAQIESLYVASQRKLGSPVVPQYHRTSFQNAGFRTVDRNGTEQPIGLQRTSSHQ